MKIVIFGATGGTGKALVGQALAQGHEVTALVRNPTKLTTKHKKLSIVQGDVFHPEQAEKAIAGNDAVLSALGVSRGAQPTVCSEGTRNIISAMKKHGVKRLVIESAYGAGDTRKGFYGRLLWIIIRARIADKERMEQLTQNSNLDWVIVRPVALTNGPRTGKYRVGSDLPVSLWPTISRADTADWMLTQATDNTYVHKILTIAY
jgi:putative NADH-flavin reductase